MKYLLVILFALLLASCSDKGRAETKEGVELSKYVDLGKYVYIDDNDVCHIRSTCMKLRHGKDENGHEIYAKHLIDTIDFIIAKPEYFRVCVRCIGDREYEHILRISERNKGADDSLALDF